jgi:mono/diheme cytochrome c family protein
MRHLALFVQLLIAGFTLAGCGSKEPPAGTASGDSGGRWYTPAQVDAGRALYRAHCGGCHGEQAEGAARWNRPGPEGGYPPPPLNGRAHAWHHPLADLGRMIKYGIQGRPSDMPAWEGTLTDAEIFAVIAWFQSLWPEEIYAAWARMDRQSRAGR